MRTEIQTATWQQCYRCRKPTYMHELVAMRDVTSVGTTWWGFPLIKWQGVVSVCPPCAEHALAIEQTRRRWATLGLGGGTVVLLSWQYLGLLSLIPALLVVVGGAFFRRRRTRALVHRGNNG